MFLKKTADVPEEIKKVRLTDWYDSLNDQEKVKIKRYLSGSDTSSIFKFSVSVMKKANEDENYSVTVFVGEGALQQNLSDIERFDVMEELIPAYFNVARYDECQEMCEKGLDLLVQYLSELKGRNNGALPERIMCRNYLINVIVGAKGDYDAGDLTLERFVEMGLITEEEMNFRKQSHKVHKLQKTFDGIYGVKLKEQ